jgi:NAD(P)-dependent dehydrogenase (short-subunit alcohol dehydrogenase family)
MRTAIVTGGAAGIGAAIVRQMLDSGLRVICLDRIAPSLEHPDLHAEIIDLQDPAATRALAAELAARFAVSHVIHNAGAIRPALLDDVTDADMAALHQLHLGAALQITQAVLPGMRAAGFGRIVLISSRGALGLATRTAYAATKSGMIGLARSWALELAPAGITVNVIAPGPIADTAMFRGVIPAGDPREASLAAAIPVRRLGRADDVARAVMFFADPAADFVTGQVLFVCGGASVGALTF